MPFKTVTRLNAALFLCLGLGLLAAPAYFVQGFGLEVAVAAEVMARRAGMIFTGLSPLYASLSGVSDPRLQQAIARSSIVIAGGLVILGLVEFAFGRVSTGVFVPVGIELVFVFLYLPLALRKPDA